MTEQDRAAMDAALVECYDYIRPDIRTIVNQSFERGFESGMRFAMEGCEKYLKEGESISECLKRNRHDLDIALGLLAKNRLSKDQEIFEEII